jgi:hypothetical protein
MELALTRMNEPSHCFRAWSNCSAASRARFPQVTFFFLVMSSDLAYFLAHISKSKDKEVPIRKGFSGLRPYVIGFALITQIVFIALFG